MQLSKQPIMWQLHNTYGNAKTEGRERTVGNALLMLVKAQISTLCSHDEPKSISVHIPCQSMRLILATTAEDHVRFDSC